MKIFRFKYKDQIRWGILEQEYIHPVAGSIFGLFEPEKKRIPLADVQVLSPVMPGKIICVGRNYKEHAEERGRDVPSEPLIFLKPPSAVIGPGREVVYPEMAGRLDYEGELALVVKKRACRLDENTDVFDYILGYTCFNDVTARDLQDRDGQWTRAKSFDTFAAMGPCIATDIDPGRVRLKTFLNGKLKQSGNTRWFIFPVPVLLRYISCIMTLYPGDVISTGTPAGIGPMYPGDRVDVQIEGIGTLSNTVISLSEEEKVKEPS
jgi:2-keto-4-pentenoate hydratase/2-oxohepta-3-ene-1,7-dioic acid hydratase in catechol pathway